MFEVSKSIILVSTKKLLFSDFETISSKQWKQQIQYELKGADYNETLVWESLEGIKVKPFYHNDEVEESNSNLSKNPSKEAFKILQNIFVHDVKKSNERTLNTLNRGAESIRFTIENDIISIGSEKVKVLQVD
jgi:methylmalonyl-CoA mutase